MSSKEILSTYEAIAALTGEMLAAARASNWDRLADLEKDCAALIDKLRAEPAPAPAEPGFVRRKAEIIHRVLADDAAIREITQPWLATLRDLLQQSARASTVSRAYGANGGHG
jgi:flagellar protein FliT